MYLLLAEMELSLGIGLIISIGTVLITIGGTWALNKYKVEAALKKVDSNTQADEAREKSVAEEIKALRDQMEKSAREAQGSAREIEKTMTRRLDDLREGFSEVKTNVSVIKSELSTVQSEQKDLKRKVTMFGRWSKMRGGSDPDDTFHG